MSASSEANAVTLETVESLKSLVADDFAEVNALIIDRIQSQTGLIDELSHHIVQSGGKRLRPLLVLLASRACHYSGNDHIKLAAMVEFFHTATLLHDDVVDESTLRRGRSTANAIWGSKASILVGDYLFTQSVKLMTGTGHQKILEVMADTSHEISCGEVRQLSNRHNHDLGLDAYFEVIRSKTALLFAACASMGALLADKPDNIVNALHQYGLHLGNAFQLIDDALDYCSSAETLGKNVGDDLADGKATLPVIYALRKGTPDQQAKIRHCLKEGSLEYLPEILETLNETRAIEYTRAVAAEQVDKSLSALQLLPDSVYKEALAALAKLALERSH